ncbi:MAG: hypothetical protein ICV78_04925, partial [Tolypothrix sp. Co-bin9]|nr:hypothetical protein [Tolypothrix sp. Co-bin9]
IEDAFKIIVSGGIVAPNTPLPPLVIAKDRKLEAPQSETQRQIIPLEEA